MVVIDEEEYNELGAQTEKIDPFTGRIAKFKMDKFYGKDMHLPKLTKQEIQDWFDWWKNSNIINFKYSQKEFDKDIKSIPFIQSQPNRISLFSDRTLLAAAEVADIKMKEAEKLAKTRRKERLKEFHTCLLQYLNNKCNATYKIK